MATVPWLCPDRSMDSEANEPGWYYGSMSAIADYLKLSSSGQDLESLKYLNGDEIMTVGIVSSWKYLCCLLPNVGPRESEPLAVQSYHSLNTKQHLVTHYPSSHLRNHHICIYCRASTTLAFNPLGTHPTSASRSSALSLSIMATTMVYTTGASVEEPSHSLTNATSNSRKARHRPKALHIKPLDPNELSAKLDDLSVGPYGQPSPSIHIENSARPPLSATSMSALSPRTIPAINQSAQTTTVSSRSFKKDKVDDKLNLPSPSKPPRRGSIFDAFRFKGSNYTEEAQKQKVDDAPKPARYKHVPQVAAEQFARTTTVEPLTQKASPNGLRPPPGPRSMSNATISLHEYNKQYRRTQSIGSGRPSNGHNHSRMAGNAEMNERSSQQKKQNLRSSMHWHGNRPELPRRMSTGNMSGKNDPQPPSPFRRDSTSVGGFQGNNAPSLRRGSASSSGFSDTSSAFARDSGLATPLKQEFSGNTSPNRRGSETSAATSGSRRGSFVNVPNPQHTAEIHRVDWSQSDQSTKIQQDSKWGGLKQRKASVSQQNAKDEKEGPHVIEVAVALKSPKTGFFKRLMH